MPDKLTNLIKQLKTASTGTPKLSREVAITLGWKSETNLTGFWWRPNDGGEWRSGPPDFTQSLDAAAWLLPGGDGISWILHSTAKGAVAAIVDDETMVVEHAATPALALCVAALCHTRDNPTDEPNH